MASLGVYDRTRNEANSDRVVSPRTVMGDTPETARAVIGTRPAVARSVIGRRPAVAHAVGSGTRFTNARKMITTCVGVYAMVLLMSQTGGVDGARACDDFAYSKPVDSHAAEFVAFSVGSLEYVFGTDWVVVPMEVDIYNPDSHFNHTTNSFTAPVTGVYSFFFGGLSTLAKTTDIHLFTKTVGSGAGMGEHVMRAYGWSNNYSGAAASVMVRMEAGETATVWMQGTPHSTARLMGGDIPTTVFSGELKKRLG